ncbi:MAG: hypothetical protein LBS21_08810 [Clostridiales bacterium]|jgi:hypothetical protein|nr:hypothetical protein [Clostridiales bacterium]
MNKSVIQQIEDAMKQKRINPRYDLSLDEYDEIHDASPNAISAAIKCFVFGYLRGAKAAEAEMKHKIKAAKN